MSLCFRSVSVSRGILIYHSLLMIEVTLSPLDVWCSKLFNMQKYSSLSEMVKTILSCFHGPQVEDIFTIMSDVTDKRSGKILRDILFTSSNCKVQNDEQKEVCCRMFLKRFFAQNYKLRFMQKFKIIYRNIIRQSLIIRKRQRRK